MGRAHSSTSVLVAVALALGGACTDLAPSAANAPVPAHGVVDLSSWDFDKDGPVALGGTWDFLWGPLPDDVNTVSTRTADAELAVPGQWDVAGFAPLGGGTYRLRVLLPASPTPLALSKSHADSAFVERAVDVATGLQSEVMHAGTLASLTPSGALVDDDEHPDAHFAIGTLPRARALILLSTVTNASYPRGGEGAVTMIGTRAQLERRRSDQCARDFFLAGFFFVVGLYHLVMFALRRADKAPLWFGCFCLVMAARILERGRHFEDLFPGADLWVTTKRLEYLSFYLASPIFAAYIDALLGHRTNRFVRRAITAVLLLLSAVVVVTRPIVFGHTALAAQVILLVVIVWLAAEIARAYREHGDRTLLVVMLGFVIMGVSVMLDMLSNAALIQLPLLGPFGQAAFVIAQAAVIASAHARARKDAEDLTRDLMRMSKLKDEFLANTSHELRTPLNTIINVPRALLDELAPRPILVCSACGALYADDPDADIDNPVTAACAQCGAALVREERRMLPDDADALAKHLGAVIGSGEQLLAVVEDVFDSSKLAAGNVILSMADVALTDVVAAAVARVSAGDVVVRQRVDASLRLHGDKQRLAQALRKLLENAVKHSPPGAAVDVEGARVNEMLEVRVIDRGPGIARAHHAVIFEAFRQVDAGHTRKHGGAGLGLAIARQLVELHRGTVTVDSDLGRGATFIVRLPRPSDRPGDPSS
ncbi:MAG TPA: sensor histidine kinase [Myxococcota bacterium]